MCKPQVYIYIYYIYLYSKSKYLNSCFLWVFPSSSLLNLKGPLDAGPASTGEVVSQRRAGACTALYLPRSSTAGADWGVGVGSATTFHVPRAGWLGAGGPFCEMISGCGVSITFGITKEPSSCWGISCCPMRFFKLVFSSIEKYWSELPKVGRLALQSPFE